MFILPAFHRIGIGTKMIRRLRRVCPEHDIEQLFIFVDPFARGFYDKVGAEFLYDSKSSIPGRMIPVYAVNVG